MPFRSSLAACTAALAVLAACGEPTAPAAPETAPEAISARPEAAPCPDDGARLPVTQICAGRAINYLDPGATLISETPQDCTWGFTETPFPGGEEVLVYRSLTCKGVETRLDFHGGAKSAALGYAASAFYGDQTEGVEPVRIFVSDPADPQKVIRDLFEGIPEPERARCQIRPLKNGYNPSDALVIEYSEAERAKEPTDEPISMCGEFGRDEDAASYWRIFGGYAWFFSLGQDMPDFDPATFMLFRKSADNTWAPAK